MATNRGFKNNPDVFCCICGEFTKVIKIKKIDDLVDNLYHDHFGMKRGDQGKSFASNIVCKICVEHFCQWKIQQVQLYKLEIYHISLSF